MRFLICIVLMSVFMIGCGQNKKEETKFQGVTEQVDYMAEGMKYLGEKNIPMAIRHFDEGIKSDPLNVDKYMVLGQIYLRLRNSDKAADTFEAAAKVDPRSAEAFYWLATSRKLQGARDEEAIRAAQKSVELYKVNQDQEGFQKSLVLLRSLAQPELVEPTDSSTE